MSTYITKRARELGLKKIDAKSPLSLTVRPQDVRLAKQGNSKCCAFARAAMHQYEAKHAYFFRSTAWLEYADRMVRYLLPQSMQKEIVSFDRSKVMTPGTYQLSAPAATGTLKAINKRSKARRGRHKPGNGKIKRGVVHRTELVRTTLEPAND